MSCDHEDFAAEVDVNRIKDDPKVPIFFNADIRISCIRCGERFVFVDVDRGLSGREPRVSVSGEEIHLPIRPASADGPLAHYGFDLHVLSGAEVRDRRN